MRLDADDLKLITEELRTRSPEAAEFYNVLREKGLLYDDGTAKPAIRMSPREQWVERWIAQAALLTPDQACHNLAHAFTLLAAAWLCEHKQPHRAVQDAGMWAEPDPDPAARDMWIKRAQNVEQQIQETSTLEILTEHAAYKRELLGEWPRSEESVLGGRSFAPEPVETRRAELPRTLNKADRIAEVARRLSPHIAGHSTHTRIIDEPVMKESDPKLRDP